MVPAVFLCPNDRLTGLDAPKEVKEEKEQKEAVKPMEAIKKPKKFRFSGKGTADLSPRTFSETNLPRWYLHDVEDVLWKHAVLLGGGFKYFGCSPLGEMIPVD